MGSSHPSKNIKLFSGHRRPFRGQQVLILPLFRHHDGNAVQGLGYEAIVPDTPGQCDLETRVNGSVFYSLSQRSLLKYTSDSRKFPLFRLH